MDHEYAQAMGGIALDRTRLSGREDVCGDELRPLDELSPIVAELELQICRLNEFLERFNGPRPSVSVLKPGSDPGSKSATRNYRSEINLLRGRVNELGSITDLISRLG